MPTAVISSSLPSASVSQTPSSTPFADVDVALVMLGHELRMKGYAFTAVPKATLARRLLVAGPCATASSLRDIFGFNLPFSRAAFPTLAEHLDAAGMSIAVARADNDGVDVDLVRSAVRFTTHGTEIVAHDAYPIFGDDVVSAVADSSHLSSHFHRLLQTRVNAEATRVLSLGAGNGAAALQVVNGAERLVLVDSNADALRLARVNLALAGISAGVAVEFVHAADAAALAGSFDLILIEGPSINGRSVNLTSVVELVQSALPKLAPGGRLIVSTTTPVIDGIDLFRAAVAPVLAGRAYAYEELEADVLAFNADGVADDDVERVAAVALEVSAARLQAVTADDFDFDGDVL